MNGTQAIVDLSLVDDLNAETVDLIVDLTEENGSIVCLSEDEGDTRPRQRQRRHEEGRLSH